MARTTRRFRFPSLFPMLAASAALAGCGAVDQGNNTTASAPEITVSRDLPTELNPGNGGAPNATLAQAAAFAWQEFFALSWPAVEQTGAANTRDYSDPNCLLSDQRPACAARPLTWQTFRGKAEIFTAGALQPYDQLPDYSTVYTTQINACDTTAPPPATDAWINLDETSEITLASMYSGVGIPQPTAENSDPQLIRFTAKANRLENDYAVLINAAGRGTAGPSRALRTATLNYLHTVGDPPPGGTNYVSLPTNTIEIKAGWRQLNPQREDASRFHTARVRYYEGEGSAMCWREGVWGLVALHIIHKTASAPYFIYATFEQSDNIRLPNGQPVEDPDGNMIATPPCRADQTAPCPTTPSVTLNDTSTVNQPSQIPPEVVRVPGNAAYCTANTGQRPLNQLYYLNNSALGALPSDGFICINHRDHAIPAEIISANSAAHAAIAAYLQANSIPSSPWSYYKLVNVQYVPIDKDRPGLYTGNDPTTGRNPASYYLANIVVETNRPLQVFSGGLVQGGTTGTNSDYAVQFGETCPTPPAPPNNVNCTHKNSFYRAIGHNMGGCMGCHGSQGQSVGGDFSVILARGTVSTPEPVQIITPTGMRMTVPRSRALAASPPVPPRPRP